MSERREDEADLVAERRDADRLLLSVGRHGGSALALLALTAIALAIAETVFPAVLGRAVDAGLGRHASRSWLTLASTPASRPGPVNYPS